MKPLIPLILAVCFIATVGQTPKPATSKDEADRILRAQIERMERRVEEAKKDDAALLEQERVAQEARAAAQTSTEFVGSPEYHSSRYLYAPYRYYPRFYPRYYPRHYYPAPLYYPRGFIRPSRIFRHYRIF